MPSRSYHPCLRSLLFGMFTLAMLSILPVAAKAQTVATLDILNPANAAGDVVVSRGTSIEVEFTVTGDSDKKDELRLINTLDGKVISKKKRGKNTTGTVNLDTKKKDTLGELRVDYLHAGLVVSSVLIAPQQIIVLAEASGGLLQLRPTTFRYKQASADGSKPRQFGLIAEEVAEVYPDLVVYNADGEVESVQYRKLTTMLLNELQKEHRVNLSQQEKMLVQAQELAKVQAQLTVVHTQYQQLQTLTARLAKLEA